MENELINFLKEERARIEDILLECGEIEEVTFNAESTNRFIQDQFSDALMIFKNGNHEYLQDFLERMSNKKWL